MVLGIIRFLELQWNYNVLVVAYIDPAMCLWGMWWLWVYLPYFRFGG